MVATWPSGRSGWSFRARSKPCRSPTRIRRQSRFPLPAKCGDRTFRPAGLLPKNTQTYVILGITAVMVGAIAFSGGNATQTKKAASNEQRTTAAIDPNLARIQEYRTRIDEQGAQARRRAGAVGTDQAGAGADCNAGRHDPESANAAHGVRNAKLPTTRSRTATGVRSTARTA